MAIMRCAPWRDKEGLEFLGPCKVEASEQGRSIPSSTDQLGTSCEGFITNEPRAQLPIVWGNPVIGLPRWKAPPGGSRVIWLSSEPRAQLRGSDRPSRPLQLLLCKVYHHVDMRGVRTVCRVAVAVQSVVARSCRRLCDHASPTRATRSQRLPTSGDPACRPGAD